PPRRKYDHPESASCGLAVWVLGRASRQSGSGRGKFRPKLSAQTCCTVPRRGWVTAARVQVPGSGGLTSHSSRRRFAARLNSGVRPRMKLLVALVLLLQASASYSQPAEHCPVLPPDSGMTWSYQQGPDFGVCYAVDSL